MGTPSAPSGNARTSMAGSSTDSATTSVGGLTTASKLHSV